MEQLIGIIQQPSQEVESVEWVSRSWAGGQGSFCGPAELRGCRCVSAGERCYETQGDGLG